MRLDRKLRPTRFQLGADRINVRHRKPDVLQPKVGRVGRSGCLIPPRLWTDASCRLWDMERLWLSHMCQYKGALVLGVTVDHSAVLARPPYIIPSMPYFGPKISGNPMNHIGFSDRKLKRKLSKQILKTPHG